MAETRRLPLTWVLTATASCLLIALHPAPSSASDGWLQPPESEAAQPDLLQRALDDAGAHRAELERVLAHYDTTGEPLKRKAAAFLIANMPGHGYATYGLYDEDGNEIPFDALDYKNYAEAMAALDAIEQTHGTVDFKRKDFISDLDTITAAYLIESIDQAFTAWRERAWAHEVSFEVFCEYILPYRCSNEPLTAWRPECLSAFASLANELQSPTDMREAAGRIQKTVHGWIGFSELYYLHPTDQGYDEMRQEGLGRCEDISNMIGYAMKANAVVSASDYTPAWADRDNNHAWEVILDENGHGTAGLSNRAAKIYRKTFSIQTDSLAYLNDGAEPLPRWLSKTNFRDVTSQYLPTSDVTVALTAEPPGETRYAYVCVFNGGEWIALQWGRINNSAAAGRSVQFSQMGRNIAYLAAYYDGTDLIPAADPFILEKDGAVRVLTPDQTRSIEIEIAATNPDTPDADTSRIKPRIPVKQGNSYELFTWDSGWVSHGTAAADSEPVSFESVPSNGLYWLVQSGSRRLERIFTVEDGRQQVWW
ncbi:MAG: hypothetical protein D8M59_05735 [Planctomycetes bacterium]|nr:hypothetical protein [Planctomycetota bacterium]NOG55917.1 hypothetical protein [Planctomycetota bacterium]